MNPTIAVSPSFEVKKQKILDRLAVPDEEYTDLSPKGSVDVKIIPLIRDINELPGLVTTSSCAGRISVFLEGVQGAPGGVSSGGSSPETEIEETLGENGEGEQSESQGQFVRTGGKGSGKWLFVSHDPVPITNKGGNGGTAVHELFGLTPGDGKFDARSTTGQLRLVRFHFEPMVCRANADVFYTTRISLPDLPQKLKHICSDSPYNVLQSAPRPAHSSRCIQRRFP